MLLLELQRAPLQPAAPCCAGSATGASACMPARCPAHAGVQATDAEGLKALGVQPAEVARLVARCFAEMIFIHGHVYAPGLPPQRCCACEAPD